MVFFWSKPIYVHGSQRVKKVNFFFLGFFQILIITDAENINIMVQIPLEVGQIVLDIIFWISTLIFFHLQMLSISVNIKGYLLTLWLP